MMDLKTRCLSTNTWSFRIKGDKGVDSVLSLKTHGVYKSKLQPLNNAFRQGTKLSGYGIGINFDKVTLAVEKELFNQNSKCLHCLWFRCLAKKSY